MNWLQKTNSPLIISGPCSAESEAQLLETAKQLTEANRVSVIRAGIWKPRTRPNAFEGVGEIGLSWLKKVKEATKLPVCTEVATAKHVELCLNYDIDFLWIGARTTASPFAVQEISDALRGIDIPVMIKNPTSPDLELWIGAIERIARSGITKIAAIHRGFSSFEKSVYRNIPMWEIPIELKRLNPQLDILCDPSHIAGSRQLIFEVCQKALDLNFSGLMIESHHDPDNALSDSKQQITPDILSKIAKKLIVRDVSSPNIQFQTELDVLRSQIDVIDRSITEKIADRMQLVEKIGQFKKSNNVTILQVERWNEITNHLLDWGKSLGLSEPFIQKLLRSIHEESIRKQEEIMNKK